MNSSTQLNGVVRDGREVGAPATRPAQPEEPQPLLIARAGNRSFALPVNSVERILRMAEITPLPSSVNGIVGVLNYRGTVLPIVDPRPTLGVPPTAPMPDQYLVLVVAENRFLLWVDEVESLVWVETDGSGAQREPLGSSTAPVASLDGRVLPILAPAEWDPRTGLVQANALVQRTGTRS